MGVLGTLIPLFVLFAVVGAMAWVGYQVYVASTKIQDQTIEKMNKRNMVFTNNGMKVGVKNVGNEKYVDATQKYVVKAWNLHDSEIKAAAAAKEADKKKKKR